MKITTKHRIAAAWETFRAQVLPKNAGPVQVDEMRKAFYAGAWALHCLLIAGVSEGPDCQPEDERLMEELVAEMEEFTARLLTGKGQQA